ncbi:MAG: putative metal-binding motif-containing protein, partial [Candidatus Woesearchaeota archaeon]|nr:putative metal-binding motif-containing protein [Candidatus Woesearchaeota archaeon]
MVNNKLIFGLFFSILLLTVAVNAKVADVAYVIKNVGNPNAQVTGVFSELNLTYRLIDDSQIGSTDFSQYKMIFIGDESFSGIESIPVTDHPSLIMNSYNYYSKLGFDDLGWSASKGQVSASMLNVKIIKLNHPIAEGLGETFKVYSGSSTLYYLKGKKATGIDLIAYVMGSSHTSADSVVAAADAGDVFLNGRTTNARNVFFGMTKADLWTVDTRKMFKNSVLWVLRGSDFDHDGYFSDVDCNDEDPNIHPGVTDIPYNGIDENCDGADLADVDADGYCKLNYEIQNKALQCANEIGDLGSDCNDNNVNIHPGATEIINNIDENCVNDAPVLVQTIINYHLTEDTNLNNAFDLDNHFKDPEGDSLTY